MKNIVEESGKGISGEVNGHQVRVGRFAYVTADESGFTPVLHMPDATYHVSDSAESDKREGSECAADVRFTRIGHYGSEERGA